MRGGPTTQPVAATAHPCAGSAYPLTPCFLAFLLTYFPVFTVQTVFAWTSAPDGPPLPYTFAAASQQNAAVRPPLAHRRRAAATVSASPIKPSLNIRYRD